MSAAATFDLDSVIVRSPELATAEVNGGVLMLSIEQGSYFDLNETGGAIWALIERPISVRAVRDALLQRFEVSPQQATDAIFAFLTKMSELKLVLPATGGSPDNMGVDP